MNSKAELGDQKSSERAFPFAFVRPLTQSAAAEKKSKVIRARRKRKKTTWQPAYTQKDRKVSLHFSPFPSLVSLSLSAERAIKNCILFFPRPKCIETVEWEEGREKETGASRHGRAFRHLLFFLLFRVKGKRNAKSLFSFCVRCCQVFFCRLTRMTALFFLFDLFSPLNFVIDS